jgi:hypothetical protein
MLDLNERVAVTEELAIALSGANDPREFFRLAILDPAERNRFLQRLPTKLNLAREYAEHAIALCLADRWTATPCWLEAVLTRVNATVQRADFAAVLVRVQARGDPNPDPFALGWIGEKYPFFDRTQLRPLSRQLLTTSAVPVLRVNGPEGAGRTYTTHVLGQFAALPAGAATILSASIPRHVASVFTLEELVAELVYPISGDPLPPPSGSSYPAQLVRWILSKAMQRPDLHVFVIEGAGVPYVSSDISLFVSELAQHVCRPATRRQARIVLIDHPKPVPSILAADAVEESLNSASLLTRADLLPCLGELNALRVKNGLKVLPAELPALADELLDQAPPDGAERLRYLHEQLLTLLSSK